MDGLETPRWILGVTPDPDRQSLSGTAVALGGHGWDLVAQDWRHIRQPLDLNLQPAPSTAGSPGHHRPLAGSPSPDQIAQVTQAVVQLAHSLLGRLASQRDAAVAVTLHDVGHWHDEPILGRSYHSWCDPFQLAAQTGLNVIDQLPAADLAAGGTGGPVELVGLWALLRQPSTTRGQTVRALIDIAPRQVDIWLLAGHAPRRAPTLAHITLRPDSTNPAEWNVAPVWAPACDTPLALPAPAEAATRPAAPLAQRIIRVLQSELPVRIPVREVLLAPSPDTQAWAELLGSCDDQLEINPLTDYGWADRGALQAAAIALTGALSVDRVAANPSDLLGWGLPRILGQFTPGSGAKWLQLLSHMAVPYQPVVQLRQAV
ncbi:MAG: hypothetical protein U0795_25820 [Pirellulales bacterium]